MVNSELTPSVSHDTKDLEGTWTLVSVVTERDGKRFDAYGPDAKGHLVFDSIGRYSIIFISGGLPKFASNSRSSPTADESIAVVSGSFAHFGTYVVDEADKSFTFQVERATFPNWDGKNTKRSFGIRVMSCTSQTPTRRAVGWRQQSSSAQSVHARSSNQGNARSASGPSRHFACGQ